LTASLLALGSPLAARDWPRVIATVLAYCLAKLFVKPLYRLLDEKLFTSKLLTSKLFDQQTVWSASCLANKLFASKLFATEQLQADC
jgi:hypothetical protein